MTLNEVQLYANDQVKAWQNQKCKTYETTSMNPTLPTYFFHILQGQVLTFVLLTFVLNSLREAEFFIEFQRWI